MGSAPIGADLFALTLDGVERAAALVSAWPQAHRALRPLCRGGDCGFLG